MLIKIVLILFFFPISFSDENESFIDPIVYKKIDIKKLQSKNSFYTSMVLFLSQIHEYVYTSKHKKLEILLKKNRILTRTNYDTLTLYHLSKFYLYLNENEELRAYNQGLAVLKSSLFNYMNPPDIEYFLFNLNQISAKNKYFLSYKFKFEMKEWFVLNNFELLQLSRSFSRQKLQTLQIKQLDKMSNYFKKSPFIFLLKSYLQMSKDPIQIPEEQLKFKHSSRWKRRNRKNKAIPYSKAILLTKKAIQSSFSNFQKSFIYHHLLFLNKYNNNSKNYIKNLHKLKRIHADSGVYNLLSTFYKQQKNWKLMHFFNSKAKQVNNNAFTISGPLPSTIKIVTKAK
ncbi:MAG: hypothetical protein COB02_04455 [Candidatus Cloacimonadota bacterium]|nr:MAG: hypothetical protein COB02_04455 [Candidatus Cloacimonadota bacterium]